MEFGKRHDTTDTTQQTFVTFALASVQVGRLCCRLVADLLRRSRQLVTDLLRGNWCNGFWALPIESTHATSY